MATVAQDAYYTTSLEYKTPRRIDFSEVKRLFEVQYPCEYSTNNWTRNMLELVNRSCNSWALIRVPGNHLGGVLLPWHLSRDDANNVALANTSPAEGK
jgi:hypothetical protein